MKSVNHDKNNIYQLVRNWLRGKQDTVSPAQPHSDSEGDLPPLQPVTGDRVAAVAEVQSEVSENLDEPETSAETPEPSVSADHDGLRQILSEMMIEMPECQALAYVDIAHNELLGIATLKALPDDVRMLVAAATYDLFNAPRMNQIADLISENQDTNPTDGHFHTITVHNDSDMYLFIRAQNKPNRVVAFSCPNTVLLGMASVQARQAMSRIEAVDI